MKIIGLDCKGEREKTMWREWYRYGVYEHRMIFDNKNVYSRSFIVLKNQYGIIVHFTCFHNYVDAYERGVCVPLASDAKSKMYYICKMLNYILIDNYETFGIEHIFNITKEMLNTFFQDYALEKQSDDSYKSRQSIEKCIRVVSCFFRKLCRKYDGYMKISCDDLYEENTVFTKRGGLQKVVSPSFKVKTMSTMKAIFRDIPTKVFQIILNQAYCITPEIAFAICLQGFAGLRPGEVCNVRQECSPLGKGLTITEVDGNIRSVEIDLRQEYILRSDGKSCGKIKKERRQCVYPAFLPAFTKAYNFHKKLLHGNFEQEYCPMFVGRSGKAMTYFDYKTKFINLIINYVRPILLKHEDSECRLYGQLLCENMLGPHALRHFYTVQLVLMGEDVAGLQYWRGDSNPESALAYLQNKGNLIKELSAVNNTFADFIFSEGGRLYGEKR